MVKHDIVAVTVFLIVAASLFALALWPELRSSISDFALFVILCGLFTAVGIYHIATARSRAAERFSQQLIGASPIRRLWLPARFYTATRLLWHLRIGGSMSLVAAAMFAFVAFLAYRRGW